MSSSLALGTRGSPLALWQAHRVKDILHDRHRGLRVEIRTLRTRAEGFPERPLEKIGVGVFTRELDDALLRGDIDLAVHSMKDIPSQMEPGLALVAVVERESPLDVFISASGTPLDELAAGSVIGTGSPRRRAQILARRPDLKFADMRGNIDTRLRKIRSENLAGTILAHAGLRRLGREEVITHLLPVEVMLPAVGQGAVAVVIRGDDARTRRLLEPLDDPPSRCAVEAERSFLRELRGGCQVPAGALATVEGERLRIDGVIASVDGSSCVRGSRSGELSRRLEVGRDLACELLAIGGREILSELRGEET